MELKSLETIWLAAIGDDLAGTSLHWYQMGMRAFLVSLIALGLIRFTGMRVFGEKSAFDVVVGIMLGAILSRAIYGGSPFFSTLFAAFVIVLFHRMLSYLSFRHHKIGILIKGNKHHLVKNGVLNWENMRRCQITEHDLMEGLREKTHLNDLSAVSEAFFERNGQISFVLNHKI